MIYITFQVTKVQSQKSQSLDHFSILKDIKNWWFQYRVLVWAVNIYPPAYLGCHNLRLMSSGLRLGGPQSHYV